MALTWSELEVSQGFGAASNQRDRAPEQPTGLLTTGARHDISGELRRAV